VVIATQAQAGPVVPAGGVPDLVDTERTGDVVVLDAGEVPDQPRDAVGPGVRQVRHVLWADAVQHVMDGLLDPAEGVAQQFDGNGRSHPSSEVRAKVIVQWAH
jgi:hypothetical protein